MRTHKKSALVIEVCVPNNLGINRAEREKVTKYQDLKYVLKESWNISYNEVIPVVVGATGMMKKNLQGYLEINTGNLQRPEVQEAAMRGTVSILKRALLPIFCKTTNSVTSSFH